MVRMRGHLLKRSQIKGIKSNRKRGRLLVSMSHSKLSFGSKMGVRVRLPTRDVSVAEKILQLPHLIGSGLRPLKVHQAHTSYLIQLASILIPGIHTAVNPETEMTFLY
ncbi:hypothetical protein EON63_24385 [archaeon]|nr:MAG: hypothetical protein EON63_24385 [archaeon]